MSDRRTSFGKAFKKYFTGNKERSRSRDSRPDFEDSLPIGPMMPAAGESYHEPRQAPDGLGTRPRPTGSSNPTTNPRSQPYPIPSKNAPLKCHPFAKMRLPDARKERRQSVQSETPVQVARNDPLLPRQQQGKPPRYPTPAKTIDIKTLDVPPPGSPPGDSSRAKQGFPESFIPGGTSTMKRKGGFPASFAPGSSSTMKGSDRRPSEAARSDAGKVLRPTLASSPKDYRSAPVVLVEEDSLRETEDTTKEDEIRPHTKSEDQAYDADYEDDSNMTISDGTQMFKLVPRPMKWNDDNGPLKVTIVGDSNCHRMLSWLQTYVKDDNKTIRRYYMNLQLQEDLYSVDFKAIRTSVIDDLARIVTDIRDDLFVVDLGTLDLHNRTDKKPERLADDLFEQAEWMVDPQDPRARTVILCSVLHRGPAGRGGDPMGKSNARADLFNERLRVLAERHPKIQFWIHKQLFGHKVLNYLRDNGEDLNSTGLKYLMASYHDAICDLGDLTCYPKAAPSKGPFYSHRKK